MGKGMRWDKVRERDLMRSASAAEREAARLERAAERASRGPKVPGCTSKHPKTSARCNLHHGHMGAHMAIGGMMWPVQEKTKAARLAALKASANRMRRK